MKLRNHILLWLVVTSLLPLLILSVGGARYSQKVFIESIDSEMLDELNRLSTKLDELFATQRQLLRNLSRSDVVRNFGAALPRAIEAGGVTAEFSRERYNLEVYFVSLQQLVAEDAELRLLDAQGHTVIKASFGQTSKIQSETLLPYAISEKEPPSALTELLTSLPQNEISHRPLGLTSSSDQPVLLADSILPIQLDDGQRLYLIFSNFGESLDHLLDRAPRLRNAQLTVIATEPTASTEALMLYDDQRSIRFSLNSSKRIRYAAENSNAFSNVAGDVTQVDNARIYLNEYLPHPDRFTSWLLVASLDSERLLEQFKLAKWGMLGLTAIVFLLGLLIAWRVSRYLSRPISRLAHNLHAYAHNQQSLPDIPALSSEIKSLQAAFRKMTTSIEKSQQQKQRSENKLQQHAKLASLGEMAAGIGHELNNPLTNILSLGKLIKRQQEQQGDATSDVDSLISETHRASKIVSGVLNFSRQITPEIQTIELNPWIKMCIQRVTKKAHEEGITIKFVAAADLVFQGDPFQLEQVLVNLLTNAIQASERAQTIQVKTKTYNQQLVIQIIDAGEGLTDTIENRIFEPFFTTRKIGVGNGLGLSISMGIIEVHEGTLTLRNNPDRGCTAEIRLPLTHD